MKLQELNESSQSITVTHLDIDYETGESDTSAETVQGPMINAVRTYLMQALSNIFDPDEVDYAEVIEQAMQGGYTAPAGGDAVGPTTFVMTSKNPPTFEYKLEGELMQRITFSA